MQAYLRYPNLQDIRSRLAIPATKSNYQEQEILERAIRKAHDQAIGTDIKHIFMNPGQCLDELINQLGVEGVEEALLPRIDKDYGLTTLLERLNNEHGLKGLADYALHLIDTYDREKHTENRYSEKLNLLKDWLSQDPPTPEPTSEASLAFRQQIRSGAQSAALIGLGKCADPGAAIHLIFFNLLNGLEIACLVRATKYLQRYFELLLEKPDFNRYGKPAHVTRRVAQQWIAETLGFTCPVTGADLHKQSSAFVIATRLEAGDLSHHVLSMEQWEQDLTQLQTPLQALADRRPRPETWQSLLDVLAANLLLVSNVETKSLADELPAQITASLLPAIYFNAGCYQIECHETGDTVWCSPDPDIARSATSEQIQRIAATCRAIESSLKTRA